jgi:hypothetical protein
MDRWLALPLLLAAWGYARVLDGEFLLDDLTVVVGDPAVRDLGAALRGLWPWLLEGRRPVTLLTFAFDHARGGLQPRAFHLTSLAIHLAVTVLAYLFARLVLKLAGAARPTGLAVAVAGLFALHPLQSQAVSQVGQRAGLLAAGLYLATLLLLVSAERRGPSLGGALALLGALSTFALGLGTAPLLVTLPVTWLLLAWAVPTAAARRILATWPRRRLVLLPFLALEAAFLLRSVGWRAVAGEAGPTGLAADALPPGTWLVTQGRVLLTYLRLLLWPAGQSARWDFSPSEALAEPGGITAGLALLTLLAATVALWRWARDRRLADYDGAAGRVAGFGVAWFFVVVAGASSLAPGAEALSEPRVYLPALGLFLAAGVAAERLLSRLWPVGPARRRAAILLVTATWGVLAMALHRRNAVWESALSLWDNVVEQAPRDPGARLALGDALRARGDGEGAERQYREGIELLGDEAAPGHRLLQGPGQAAPRHHLRGALEDRLRRASQGPDRAGSPPPGP